MFKFIALDIDHSTRRWEIDPCFCSENNDLNLVPSQKSMCPAQDDYNEHYYKISNDSYSSQWF